MLMDSPPSPPGGGGGGGGGGPLTPDYAYSTNDLWLEILQPGTNAYNANTNSATLLLHGTVPDVAYILFSATNLNAATTGTVWTAWTIEQDLIGAENTNVTHTTVSMVGRPMRIDFEMIPYGEHFALIKSYVNPTGSRNLESDANVHFTRLSK